VVVRLWSSIVEVYAYDEDDAELLRKGPPQTVLVMFVRRVGRGRCAILCAGDGALLLDEDVRDEAVDHRGADGCVAPRPEDHPGCVDDFECVQHGAMQFERRPRCQWQLLVPEDRGTLETCHLRPGGFRGSRPAGWCHRVPLIEGDPIDKHLTEGAFRSG
jgi:hypothetical protein